MQHFQRLGHGTFFWGHHGTHHLCVLAPTGRSAPSLHSREKKDTASCPSFSESHPQGVPLTQESSNPPEPSLQSNSPWPSPRGHCQPGANSGLGVAAWPGSRDSPPPPHGAPSLDVRKYTWQQTKPQMSQRYSKPSTGRVWKSKGDLGQGGLDGRKQEHRWGGGVSARAVSPLCSESLIE